MANRRNFIQYELPTLSRNVDKNKKPVEVKKSQTAKITDENLHKPRAVTSSISLTTEEIFAAFDHDLLSNFYNRGGSQKQPNVNEKLKLNDVQKDNAIKTQDLKSLIFKPNYTLNPSHPDENKPRDQKLKINAKAELISGIGENQTKNYKKRVLYKHNFSDNIKKTNQLNNDFIEQKTLEKDIEKLRIDSNQINTLTIKETQSLNNQSNKNTEEFAQIADKTIIPLPKNEEIGKLTNPTQKKNNPKKTHKTNVDKVSLIDDSDFLPLKTKKPRKKPSNPNQTNPSKKNATKPKNAEKTTKKNSSTNPKPLEEVKKTENEFKSKNQSNLVQVKPLKKTKAQNENLVRLNLKKIYKDRFRGQLYNYKNNYKSNGRPKNHVFKRNVISIKSYKIEQMLSGANKNIEEPDPYLSSLSESLKFSIYLNGKEAPNQELPPLPDKNPLDYTDSDFLEVLKQNFGFESFRTGQLEAIKSLIKGNSTLVILQTGVGKSLIYAMSSLLIPGLTIVISPLVSLMFDQIEKLPYSVPGACINGLLKPENKAKIYDYVKAQRLKILYISPETLETSFIFDLETKINLVCIDEIHCVSEWSHNFRTSYLKLSYLIKDRLKTQLILGLTATATSKTITSVTRLFDIKEIISSKTINRTNLMLTTSRDQDKFPSLLFLLRSEKYQNLKSIIIYCTLIRTTENVANYLTQSGIPAIPYHSNCHDTTRLKIQKEFMNGKTRIVVATLAFGMGIDKKDVDGIIHLNIPKSLENYIQEIGRAGRNGKSAFCHLFITDEDYYRMRGYILAESLDEYVLRKMLKRVFKKVNKSNSKRKGWEEDEEELQLGKISYILENDLCNEMECNASMIMTILLKIEEFSCGKFEIFPLSKIVCNLGFYRASAEQLKERYELIERVLALARVRNGVYTINLVKMSNDKGTTPLEIMRDLQQIAMKEGISFEMNAPAFCFRVKEELEEKMENSLIEYILRKANEIEKQMLFKVVLKFLNMF